MKTRISSAVLALALLASPSLAGTLSPAEAAILRGFESPGLAGLRAGAVSTTSSLTEPDRAVLRAAETRSPELPALRAGDLHLTDHDLMVIGIVLGIVILILLI